MVFREFPAHHEGMDAYQLTRPILSATPLVRRRPAPTTPAADPLVEARRYVHQLPLGRSPSLVGRRTAVAPAPADIERALWRTAAAFGVCVSSTEAPADLARRLVRARAIVAPAADAVATLVPALEAGAGGDAAHLASRLLGYLDARATR